MVTSSVGHEVTLLSLCTVGRGLYEIAVGAIRCTTHTFGV